VKTKTKTKTDNRRGGEREAQQEVGKGNCDVVRPSLTAVLVGGGVGDCGACVVAEEYYQ